MLYAAVGTRGLPTPVQPDLGNNGANGVYSRDDAGERLSGRRRLDAAQQRFSGRHRRGTPNTTIGRSSSPLHRATADALRDVSDANNARAACSASTSRPTAARPGRRPDAGHLLGCGGAGSQMWYDAGLTVSPTDPNVLFVSTVDLFRSINGGTTFTI